MNPLSQTFGVEIECYLPAGLTREQAAPAIAARIGEPCEAVALTHRTTAYWKITTDGSLVDLDAGLGYERVMELVSPVLSGESGFAKLGQALEALDDLNCFVSTRCGLHVHVGHGPDPRLQFFQNLAKLYGAYEPVIDAFMPRSRRGNGEFLPRDRNGHQLACFCGSIAHVAAHRIDGANNRDQLVTMLCERARGERYVKLNLATHRGGHQHPTVEFRHHSGTLNYRKARNWVMLCLLMTAHAQMGDVAAPTIAPQVNRGRLGSKHRLIGEMLLSAHGVTREEAIAATGWVSISIPQQAEACGLAITPVRMGRNVRYYARQSSAVAGGSLSAPAQPTLETFFEALNCDLDIRDYYRARTANLARSTTLQA